MIDTKFIDDLAKKFLDSLPPAVKDLKIDIEKYFKTAVKSAFSKMDLITREEFDVQVKVLERTREKIAALEKEVKNLHPTKAKTRAQAKSPAKDKAAKD